MNLRLASSLPALVATAALAVAAPAAAEHPSPLELHREIRGHLHDVLHELGRVPDRIHDRHRAHLQILFGGSSWYAPHRHHHATYRFPVWVDGVVAYRPYVYCDDRLFGAPGVRFELWLGDPYPRYDRYRAAPRVVYPSPYVRRDARLHHRHDRYCDHRPHYDAHRHYDRDWRRDDRDRHRHRHRWDKHDKRRHDDRDRRRHHHDHD